MVLYGVANLMNERLIGVKPGSCIDLDTYLWPNERILGRASVKVLRRDFALKGDPNKRFRFISELVDGFWKKWQKDYFPEIKAIKV